MRKQGPLEKNPKDLLRQAEKTARAGEVEEGLKLFEACVREYVRQQKPFKALAAAKVAKSSFGSHPRAHAMLIRLLKSMDLTGDLDKEYAQSSAMFGKDEISIFRDLSRDEFIELLDIMHLISVGKGGHILRQEDPGQDIYTMLEGSAGVYRDGVLVSVLHPGDVFGELGFFFQAHRSASVTALSRCRLTMIPARELRLLCTRFPRLVESLDSLYRERILRKAGEELGHHPLTDLSRDALTTVRVARGQAIELDSSAYVTIIKHGIVEVDMNEHNVMTKRFLRPGHVLERLEGAARANTDVELIRAKIDLTGGNGG